MDQARRQVGQQATDEVETRARVVIVDDHPLWTESVQLALERTQRFRMVGTASEEQEGIDLIRHNLPDVALVDIRLPGGTEGINVARAGKEHSPSTKIVMLTGSDDPSHVHEVLALDVAGFLSKDIGILQLAHAVECIHAGLHVLSRQAFEALTNKKTPIPSPLSEHEQALLGLASAGLRLDEIASRVASSRAKVNRDLLAIQHALGAGNRVEAVVVAVREGWI